MGASAVLSLAYIKEEFFILKSRDEEIELPVQQNRSKKKSCQIFNGFVPRDFMRSKNNSWKPYENHFIQLIYEKFNNNISKFSKLHIHIIRVFKTLTKNAPIN